MIANFVSVNGDGLVSLNQICKVAGLGGNPPRDGTYEYYVSEPVVSDDYKGVGAFMLAANELGR
jgi:unsaturated rhamnogalacturonyl hydrolase